MMPRSNRTFMELKFYETYKVSVPHSGSNRTFMELKLDLFLELSINIKFLSYLYGIEIRVNRFLILRIFNVLIVPLWN